MRYSVIHWGYSPPRAGMAGNTWITRSEAEHREAMAEIRRLGGYVHDWH